MARSKAFNCTYTSLSDFVGKSAGFKYNCPHGYKTQPYTLSLDWLQINVELDIEPSLLGTSFDIGCYRWEYQKKGTNHYKYLYTVFIGLREHFTICVSPHAGKKQLDALIQFENGLLYSDWLAHYYQIREAFIKTFHSVSRIDFAFDGFKHVYDLLTDWRNNKEADYNVRLTGKSAIRSTGICRRTKKDLGFRIGSNKGNKQISVYNKTKEIAKTMKKEYIYDYWQANELIKDKNDIPDIYRFEVRLYNGWLKECEGENLPVYEGEQFLINCADSMYIVAVCNVAMYGLFEWIYKDDKNVSRCTRVQLLPFSNREFVKVTNKKIGSIYKAKMTVHNVYMQTVANIVGHDEGLAIIQAQLESANLKDWYRIRVHEFCKKYPTDNGALLGRLFGLAVGANGTDISVKDRLRAIAPRKINNGLCSRSVTLMDKDLIPVRRSAAWGGANAMRGVIQKSLI